ncbi:MAG TPA: hypothetical protein PLX69_23735, partial [Leptospiraceae bacterium]|nr:hypothetical protein [Leptospiraceae bacterium]
RQKVGGLSFSFFILKQLPVLPPERYTRKDIEYIVPRVVELVYTAWDIKAFADDVWCEADNTDMANFDENADIVETHGRASLQGVNPELFQKLEVFLHTVVESEGNEQMKFTFWEVDATESERLKQKLGIDLLGYTHCLENYTVRHVLKQHGNKESEEKRGQEIVVPADFMIIPKILKDYDAVELTGENKKGLETIRYTKEIGNTLYYFEEIRTGKKELMGQTLYIKKQERENAGSKNPLPLTSETSLLQFKDTAGKIKKQEKNVRSLRGLIVNQWDDNKRQTGGHENKPPEWAKDYESDCAEKIPLAPFKWNEERRAVLKAELDAYYAKLYGLTRKQLRYILDPHGLSDKELENILDPTEDDSCWGPDLFPRDPSKTFPGETFRVLKDKETKLYGFYRTRRLVLDAWERLGE